MVAGNGSAPLSMEHSQPQPQVNPHPVICIEFHNYKAGPPEINLVRPDGVGVEFPAEHLELIRMGLEMLSMLREKAERGSALLLTVDSEGSLKVEWEKER